MFLELKHDSEQSTTEAAPIIYLKRIKVTVETIGEVRCAKYSYPDLVAPFEFPIIIGEYDGSRGPLPLTERMDLRRMLDLKLNPRFIKPAVITLNIKVHHVLSVKVAVECAQETLKAEWISQDLRIMGERYQAPAIPRCAVGLLGTMSVKEPPYGSTFPQRFTAPPFYEKPIATDSKYSKDEEHKERG